MKHLDHTVDRTAFVWALGSVCQLHKIPFDANLLLQQITPPYNIAGLLNAGQQLGLKIKVQSAAVSDLTALPLPCIALMKRQPSGDGNAPPSSPNTKIEPTLAAVADTDDEALQTDAGLSDAPFKSVEPDLGLVLILRADQDRLLCIEPGEQNPSLLPVADFAMRFTGQVILAGIEQKAEVTDDAIGPADATAKPAFGFRWFIPELLKQKSIWRDVLLASLVIQLMALATPVFSNRKMRLKYFKSCGGFGSTINRGAGLGPLKQSFSSLLYFACSVIIA